MPRIIKKDECVNCGACEPVCPVECISEVDGKRLIKAADCIDCGVCESVCPVSCISEA
ncbi:MAG: 4Fe-4S binding protein [Verrucomicrobia bacterium]|nr:4Fe-4S binding protein [Verrucomicrobiota bacterium]